MKNIFIFTFIFLFGLYSCGQDRSSPYPTIPHIMIDITGKVVNPDGDGISGIFIFGEGDVIMNSTDSRGNGTFSLSLTAKPNLPLRVTVSFHHSSDSGKLSLLHEMELTFTDEDFVAEAGDYGRVGKCSKDIGEIVLEDAAPE